MSDEFFAVDSDVACDEEEGSEDDEEEEDEDDEEVDDVTAPDEHDWDSLWCCNVG